MTAIKQEIIINFAPNPIKFIHSITENFERKENQEFYKILKTIMRKILSLRSPKDIKNLWDVCLTM